MARIENDISIASLRGAASTVAENARSKAFAAGTTVAYIEGDKLIRESHDGTKVVVSSIVSKQVRLVKKVWTIG
ncbi:MAG TPA: hypothetical protein VMV83_03680 [Rectinemataceae bacterium]|nr:hypothetical protein [Rectinemataceae bacterium]